MELELLKAAYRQRLAAGLGCAHLGVEGCGADAAGGLAAGRCQSLRQARTRVAGLALASGFRLELATLMS